MPRSNFGQKVIFWAFYRQSSNFAALVRPLRARARAGDRPGHTILAEYLCPTEPGSAETAPVLRGLPRKTITRLSAYQNFTPGHWRSLQLRTMYRIWGDSIEEDFKTLKPKLEAARGKDRAAAEETQENPLREREFDDQ